jgi:uncharacterized protein (DUF2132 family)
VSISGNCSAIQCGEERDRRVTDGKPNDPLHGVTLEMILNRLVAYYGWETMGGMIHVRCFTNEPSIASSLQFLRRTPWARSKVEALYLRYVRERAKEE